MAGEKYFLAKQDSLSLVKNKVNVITGYLGSSSISSIVEGESVSDKINFGMETTVQEIIEKLNSLPEVTISDLTTDRNTVGENGVVGLDSASPNVPVTAADNTLAIATNTDGTVRICAQPPEGYYNGNAYIGIPATSFGTATKAQVLSGKTFTSTDGLNVAGTMTDNSSKTSTSSYVTGTFKSGVTGYVYATPASDGYFTTGTYIRVPVTNLKAENIVSGVTVGGVVGSASTVSGTVSNFPVASGKTVVAGDFVSYVADVVGTDTVIDSSGSLVTSSGGISIGGVAMLSATKAFVMYSVSGVLYGVVCTINGTSISKGTAVSLGIDVSSSSDTDYCKVVSLSETSVFIAYNVNKAVKGLVCTINGTTITQGSVTSIGTISSSGTSLSYYLTLTKLTSSKVFITYYGQAIVCTVSGTTITKGSYTSLSTSTQQRYRMSVSRLNDTSVVVSSGDASVYAMVCTVNGTTITKGSVTTVISGTDNTDYRAVRVMGVGATKGICFYLNDYNYKIYAVPLSISGTSITCGETFTFFSSGTESSSESESWNDFSLIGNSIVSAAYGFGSSGVLRNAIITMSGNTLGASYVELADTATYGTYKNCDSCGGISFVIHGTSSTVGSTGVNAIVIQHTVANDGAGIIGVAKTGGTNGATIQVYTP